jgi:transposase-like protein
MNCPHCGSPNTLKKGYDRYGKQRYRCKDCGKGFGGGDKVTCRQKYLDKTTNPDNLTTNKSFSLTRKAIKLLVASSQSKSISQSALVNQLILEHLP